MPDILLRAMKRENEQLRAENERLKDVIAKCKWALENCGQAQGSDDMDDGTFCRIDLVEEALAAIKGIEK